MTIDKLQSYLMQNCALFISMHVCRSKKFGLSSIGTKTVLFLAWGPPVVLFDFAT